MGRGRERPQPGVRGEGGARLRGEMRGAMVHAQGPSLGPRIASDPRSDRPENMRVVVGFHTTPPPHALLDVPRDQPRHGPVPRGRARAARSWSPRPRVGRPTPHQHLQRGRFVHTPPHFPPVVEPGHARIAPQHVGGPGREARVTRGGLPITVPLGLPTGVRHDARDGRGVHRAHDRAVHHPRLATAAGPAGQVPTIGRRVRARDAREVHARPRGKNRAGARGAQRRKWRRPHPAGRAARGTTAPSGATPARDPSLGGALRDPGPIRPERDGPHAGSGGHQRRWPVHTADRPQIPDRHAVFALASDALLPAPEQDESGEDELSIRNKTFATVH